MLALCLTLPEQPGRTERARVHFAERGLDVKFVCAVNGHKTGLIATHTYEADNPNTGYVIGPATIGIFLSHYIAWSIAAHSEDYWTAIFEDDVILNDSVKAGTLENIVGDHTQADMVFIGSCCTKGEPKILVGSNLYSGLYPQCLHAYAITREAARILLESCRDVFGPIDCVLRLNKYFGLRVLTVLPRLAEQLNTELPE